MLPHSGDGSCSLCSVARMDLFSVDVKSPYWTSIIWTEFLSGYLTVIQIQLLAMFVRAGKRCVSLARSLPACLCLSACVCVPDRLFLPASVFLPSFLSVLSLSLSLSFASLCPHRHVVTSVALPAHHVHVLPPCLAPAPGKLCN